MSYVNLPIMNKLVINIGKESVSGIKLSLSREIHLMLDETDRQNLNTEPASLLIMVIEVSIVLNVHNPLV